jgi:ABC-type glycerol-3-phosphate transport system substrate-binding protein
MRAARVVKTGVAVALSLGAGVAAVAPVTVHVAVWDPLSPRAEAALRTLATRLRVRAPQIALTFLRNPAADAPILLKRWGGEQASWRPELVVISDLWLPEVGAQLQPLPEPVVRRLRAHLPPTLLARLTYDEQLKAVPWWIEPRLLFYWPGLLDRRHWQPKSWEEVVEAAAGVSAGRGAWGLGIPGSGLELIQLLWEMVWAGGGSLQNAAGELDLTAPALQQALDLLVRADRQAVTQPQLLTWTQRELEQAFVDRKLACLAAGASLEESLLGARAKYGVAALPAREPFVSASMDCLAAFCGAAAPEASEQVMAFLASPEGQACMAEAGSLPPYPDLATRLTKMAALQAAAAGWPRCFGLPQTQWRALQPALERAFYLALSGRCSVRRALEEAQALLRRSLATP